MSEDANHDEHERRRLLAGFDRRAASPRAPAVSRASTSTPPPRRRELECRQRRHGPSRPEGVSARCGLHMLAFSSRRSSASLYLGQRAPRPGAGAVARARRRQSSRRQRRSGRRPVGPAPAPATAVAHRDNVASGPARGNRRTPPRATAGHVEPELPRLVPRFVRGARLNGASCAPRPADHSRGVRPRARWAVTPNAICHFGRRLVLSTTSDHPREVL